MKKINELTETRWRTVYHKDEDGNRYSETEEFEAFMPVLSVSGGQRFIGFFVDMILFQIIFYVIEKVFGSLLALSSINSSLGFVLGWISFIVTILSFSAYYAIFEYQFQKSPAKFLMRTIVVDEFGNKPDLRTILLRSIIRIVPFDALSFWWSTYGRGWHDEWSKTFVVTEEYLAVLKKMQKEQSEA